MRTPSPRFRLGALALGVATLAGLLAPGVHAAAPVADLPAGKVDGGLRGIVAHGGYADDGFYRALAGDHAGDVYFLAELAAPDDTTTVAALAAAGARVRHRYDAITWVALAGPVSSIARVALLPQVVRLESDLVQEVQAEATTAPDAAAIQAKRGTGDVGAPGLWAQGITGRSVTVGVADTGVDAHHPDLDEQTKFFVDCTNGTCTPATGFDDNGHGTHVSGIATGTGEASDGRFPGIARGASLAVAKVMTPAGIGLSSDIMAGFELLAKEKAEGGAGADVINASLGSGRLYGSPLFYAEQVTNRDAEAVLVNALAAQHNVVFTISAGNSGPAMQSLGSPGVAAQALTVAASAADFDRNADVEDTVHGEFGHIRDAAVPAGASVLAGFSSRGPSGDRLIKPDLTAPGVYWVAPESSEGGEIRALDAAHGNAMSTNPDYAVLSGTSMSAPAAAGAAALVIDGWNIATHGQAWRYSTVKAALVNTAGARAFEGPVAGAVGTITTKVEGKDPEAEYPIRNDAWVGVTGEGSGRVDAGRALLALTKGLTVLTPQVGALDDVHELQPSWSIDSLVPGQQISQAFQLSAGPLAARPLKVTFKALAEPQATGVQPIPASWYRLPGQASLGAGASASVPFTVKAAAGAAPGLYAGIVDATADLGGKVVQHVRIPVQLYVALTPSPAKPSVVQRNDIWASDTTDYSIVGFENPEGDIYTDWLAYSVRIPTDAKSVTTKVWDPQGEDALDLFVFDSQGIEIDGTASMHDDTTVPAGAAIAPTGPDSPASATILDGDDNADAKVKPGDTVWVVVSNTVPAKVDAFRDYHLEVSVEGGGSGPVAGTAAPAARIHSGTHAWWGGSTPAADASLTKAFDLTAAGPNPKASFWTWYELEDGYDWGFLLASTDGGATWKSVPTTDSTDLDPVGATLLGGNKPWTDGLTGTSGTDPTFTGQQLGAGAYAQQVADLTPYAGKQVLLRFAYTSDAGTDWAGFYVDDVQVAGGPVDAAEAATGWVAKGFTLVTATG
ncbi:MAG: hypothetical protein JWN67_982 [Actinomycetia bacterium]|nr:hypothetical protein [Actinomycetes bacterium]